MAATPAVAAPQGPAPRVAQSRAAPRPVQMRMKATPASWARSSGRSSRSQVTGDPGMLCPSASSGAPKKRSGFHSGARPAESAATVRRCRALNCSAGSLSWGWATWPPPLASWKSACTDRWSSALTTRGPGSAPGKSRGSTSNSRARGSQAGLLSSPSGPPPTEARSRRGPRRPGLGAYFLAVDRAAGVARAHPARRSRTCRERRKSG